MADTLISVTTYMKKPALDTFVKSFHTHDYHKVAHLHIADDNFGEGYQILKDKNPHNPVWVEVDSTVDVVNMPSALETYLEWEGVFDVAFQYGTKRGGIAHNKNRGIHFFKENPEYKYLILVDDDQYFAKPGMVEFLIKISQDNNIQHLTGVWAEAVADVKPGLSGRDWYSDFPKVSESKDGLVTWHGGCHGNISFYTRKCIDRIGYFAKFPSRYGFEHSEHSARAMRAVEKRSPEWFPQVDTKKYLKCQAISNNYFDTAEDIALNNPEYYAKLAEIAAGLNLRATDPLFDPKKETTLRSWDANS